jgi:hypothetical protein
MEKDHPGLLRLDDAPDTGLFFSDLPERKSELVPWVQTECFLIGRSRLANGWNNGTL